MGTHRGTRTATLTPNNTPLLHQWHYCRRTGWRRYDGLSAAPLITMLFHSNHITAAVALEVRNNHGAVQGVTAIGLAGDATSAWRGLATGPVRPHNDIALDETSTIIDQQLGDTVSSVFNLLFKMAYNLSAFNVLRLFLVLTFSFIILSHPFALLNPFDMYSVSRVRIKNIIIIIIKKMSPPPPKSTSL